MFDLKKLFCITICLMIAGTAFAADFVPSVMEITVPEVVQYNFDGTIVDIDVNIAGQGGVFWLVINTKDKEADINMVQNGFLGWHTVNKIDTTVYISGVLTRTTGDVTVSWDGNDNDGNAVVADAYDYYLYGYDDANSRIPACLFMQAGSGWRSHNTFVLENGEDGLPLANPILTSNNQGTGNYSYLGDDAGKNGTQTKWILGGDPSDFNNVQWTNCDIYPAYDVRGDGNYFLAGGTAYNPTDHSIFYHVAHNIDGGVCTLLKWSFVNQGSAILDEDWGGWENITLEKGNPNGYWQEPMSTITDGDNLYVQDSEQTGVHVDPSWNYLYAFDWDGEEIFAKNFLEFYMPDDASEIDGCGMLKLMDGVEKDRVFLGYMGCCMPQFISTATLLAEGDAEEVDYLRWRNGQGDFYYDVYWQADASIPWACLNNSERSAHRVDTVTIDSNGFNLTFATFIGSFSHGVQTQDGTSLLPGGLMAFADDALSDSDPYRGGGMVVDNGSAYDGIYVNSAPPVTFGVHETFYVANDSAHGVITNQIAVAEDAAAAFAVAQNSPNPFNPTTSINFTLPVDGKVSVDVFNVAGQKVDTLVDDYMNAGQHNVTWDASGFSNGVYFYSVKAGEMTKTMKMTLLK